LKKFISILLIGLLVHSSVFAYTDRGIATSVDTLSPSVSSATPEFKERFKARSALLSHDAVNKYISEYFKTCRVSGAVSDGFPEHREDSIKVPGEQGSYEQRILIVNIEGLLSNTGQIAHVGLGSKNKMPTIYIDSEYCYNEAILRHEKDEISQWEAERNKRSLTYAGMRDWIKKYINTPEPSTGLTSRQIADRIHASSYNIDHIYDNIKYRHPELINYDSVYERYLECPRFDREDLDINIAAKKDSDEENVLNGFMLLNDQLQKLFEDASTGLTPAKISEISKKLASGETKLSGEQLDVIKVEEDGREVVIGQIDARVAHENGFLHRTANAFIIMPDGKIVIQRRVHNRIKPLMFTIPGGHVRAGKDYSEVIRKEFVEEIGLPEGWEPQGRFHLIGRQGGFGTEDDASLNRERRSLYFYFATEEEAQKIHKNMDALETIKCNISKESFKKWIETQQEAGSLYGETWGLYEFTLDELIDIANGKSVRAEDNFSDGPDVSEIVLTDDLLEGLLLDGQVVTVLRNALFALEVDRATIEDGLKQARGYFVSGDREKASEILEKALKDIELLLSVGCSKDDAVLALYYNARVMKKMMNGFKDLSDEPMIKDSTQILLLDSDRQSILLQVRGPFKRLFAEKRTVSANAKPKDPDSVYKAAAEAVEDETGLSVDPERFAWAEPGRTRVGRLVSLDFIAFSAEEEKALRSLYNLMVSADYGKGITVEWNQNKRSLCVYSVDPECNRSTLYSIAKTITNLTGIGIEPLYPVFNEDHTSMLLYVLTADEERQVRAAAEGKLRAKKDAETVLLDAADDTVCKAVDSDDMVFESWIDVKKRFEERPQDYALDLTGPAFSKDSFWEAAFPSIIPIDNEDAGIISVSGGKGANTHILRELAASGEITGLNVPDSSVVTTYAYQRIVLGDPEIRKEIERLETEKDEMQIKLISKRIREKILKLTLPERFKEAVTKEFHKLGGDIYVRSSATVEDLEGFSAAGLAESYPHIIKAEEAQESVKQVWASLFSDGFVNARNIAGLSHKKALMGVLLQKSIEPKAAGVVFTIHSNERPIYNITAQPGAGEGVVQGKGNSDMWMVGYLADTILEWNIAHKTYRVAIAAEGGTKEEKIDSNEACMNDEEVLEVARLVKFIQRKYKEKGLAKNVDVEYVTDAKGNIYVVQTRPKESFASDEGDNVVFLVDTVDEPKVPPDTVTIELDPQAPIAAYGAVTARLQVLIDTSGRGDIEADKHLAAQTKPGVILVTHHTNNEFNGVFSKLSGVITTDGNLTSHAAQNSAPLKIPCLVGASDAIEKLKQHDGQLVTVDTGRRKIYLGAMPIVKDERALEIWSPNEGIPEIDAVQQREPHEIFQRWEVTRPRRPEVFLDFPEDGHLRLRSNLCRKFQVDYYYQAWDRLTAFFNRFFEGRAPWILQAQDRVVKWRPANEFGFDKRDDPSLGIVRTSLCHRIVRNDPLSVYYFVQGVQDLSEDDLQELFNARWKGFQTYARFMNSIESIDAGNVERAVDELIDIFVWMHAGFWIDVTVTHLFAHDQLRYINSQYGEALREEAVHDLPKNESVDESRPDVPPGKILKLSRVKDREIAALVERVWNRPRLVETFGSADHEQLKAVLASDHQDILDIVDSWSVRFKETSEHLDELSDTDAYLEDIRGRVMNGTTIKPDTIASWCRAYIDEKGEDKLTPLINQMEHDNEDLYLVLRGYARVSAAAEKTPDWAGKNQKDKARILTSMTEDELINGLVNCGTQIEELIEAERDKSRAVRDVLEEFPRLKKIAALAHQEFLLREDGHHLIVPHQRKMARMMLEIGEKYRDVLGDPRKVFDISTDEFIALLLEPDPSFVAATFERARKLDRVERQLSAEWKTDPVAAVRNYSDSSEEILATLDKQAASATIDRVKRSYQDEAERLRQRIEWFDDTLRMMTLKELLNKKDVSKEDLSADVLFICGNDMLDVFEEAVEFYVSGKVKKILISGGLGKGTISLIKSALLERIPIRISESEIISHESHIRRLERLNKEGKLRTVLKVSEADIIRQIMRHMARNRKDAEGNPAPIIIREEDILCEEKTTNIVEYFTNSRSILYKLRHDLQLASYQPLTVAYMHDGAIQFRTKSLFETIYRADIESGAIRGISYTLDHDLFGLRRETVQESMLREMFAMIIFSLAGHVVMDYEGQRGLDKIPQKYWQAAMEIMDRYSDKERIRRLFSGQIEGLITKEPWFPSDITEIVKRMPDNADVFGKALLRLFGVDNNNEKTDKSDAEAHSFAKILRLIRDDDELLAEVVNPAKGVEASDIVAKDNNLNADMVGNVLSALQGIGIFMINEKTPGHYCFSDMMIGPDMDDTRSLINAVMDIRWSFEKGKEIKPFENHKIPKDKMPVMREVVKSTVIHQINILMKPAVLEGKVLWHILEEDLLAESQKGSFAQGINNASKEIDGPERIWILRNNQSIEDAMLEIRRSCPDAVFDVALSSVEHIERVPEQGGIKMLVFSGKVGDIRQLEGIIAALRALHRSRENVMPSLLRIYSVMKGAVFKGEIPPLSVLDDPREFAKRFVFELPPVELISLDDQKKMNDRIKRLLIAA